MIGKEHRPCDYEKGQGDPHERSEAPGQIDKPELGGRRIWICFEERDGDKGEKEHTTNPKGRRGKMDPNQNDVK